MKPTTKAALLSGLVFPGLGQFILKRPRRGSALAVVAAACLVVLARSAYVISMMVVDQLVGAGGGGGGGDMDMADIAKLAAMVDGAAVASESHLATWASTVLLVCWIAGIIDALFVKPKAAGQPPAPPVPGQGAMGGGLS